MGGFAWKRNVSNTSFLGHGRRDDKVKCSFPLQIMGGGIHLDVRSLNLLVFPDGGITWSVGEFPGGISYMGKTEWGN